jgi:hypothetical protein
MRWHLCSLSAEKAAGDLEPSEGGELERLEVDPFVDAMEPGPVLAARQCFAEEPEPVGVVPAPRSQLASVHAASMAGTSSAPWCTDEVTSASTSQSGVECGESVALAPSITTSTGSTRSANSPRMSWMMCSMSSPSVGRMLTWTVTVCGIVLALSPPCTTVGTAVHRVQA